MTTPVLLIDTYSLFFRAFHALPEMSTREGEPTSALYGFSSLLLKLLRENRQAAVAFALDAPEPTFRHQAMAAYKAGRAVTPSSLTPQFTRLTELIEALAVPAFRMPGFEADDILATLAARAREASCPVFVVSGDRDLLQVAHGTVNVYFVGRRGKDALVYDDARVRERFGIGPTMLPSYVALVGDPSDNLPSVPGVGAVTAKKLLASKQNCADLFEHIDSMAPRLRETLLKYREQILRTEYLARLRDDLPLNAKPLWAVPTQAGLLALAAFFEKLEFKSLLARLKPWLV